MNRKTRERMTLRGMLRRAGVRWGIDTPKARITAHRTISRFLEKPRALSSRECTTLAEEFLAGPTVSEWPVGRIDD